MAGTIERKGRSAGAALLRWRLLAAALLGLLLATPSLAGGFSARVAAVVDGDTLRLAGGEVVRLAGVDAPELGHEGRPDQYGAAEARQALTELAAGWQVRVEPQATPQNPAGRDRYGRLLALVVLPDGTTAQAALLASGRAFVYAHPDQAPGLAERLLPLQRKAMRQGRGFWPRLLALPAPKGGLVGNDRSRRFGPAECPVVRSVRPSHRVRLDSLRAAFDAGFAPYRECGLWPE